MTKGSQLSQLKSALSNAGITKKKKNQPPSPSKKRKLSSGGLKEREKAAKKAFRAAAAGSSKLKLEEIQTHLNPFDVQINKPKHDIGGRKVKGTVGRPAKSRLAGLEQRKKTLLKEVHERGRAGGFVDRRFGENDPTMSIEERMLERFTRERQRASKGAIFNLEDDDDDELTHYGQSLSNLDDFDNIGLGLDDDDDDGDGGAGKIDGEIVKRVHFGGFKDEEEDANESQRKKSKAEVMAEVIAKSKEHKMLRKMEREHGEDVRLQLDQDYDMLRHLMEFSKPNSSDDSDDNDNDDAGQSSSIQLATAEMEIPIPSTSNADDYDQHVRELVFDKRAKPKDRTKTEEEIALEEKHALEKSERRRQRRMLGLEGPGSDSSSDGEDEKRGGRRNRKRKRGGDDLEDDFVEDDDDGGGGDGAWDVLGEGLRPQNEIVEEIVDDDGGDGVESGSGMDDDDDDENNEASVAERVSDDGSSEVSEAEAGEHTDIVKAAPLSTTEKEKETSSKELPFTFACPSTHEEFLSVIEDIRDSDVSVVVERIRKLYHTSLGPENKLKLQDLTNVLIDHVVYTTSQPDPQFEVASSLFPHIQALATAYPIPAAEHFVEKFTLMHKNFRHGLSEGPLNLSARTWPGLPELILLYLTGLLWSTSDLNHAVVTPARILMGSYLGLARVRCVADVASGLFLCTLFLQYENLSKRLVPEAINFLINATLHLAPHSYELASELPGFFPRPDFKSVLCRTLVLDLDALDGVVSRKAALPKLLSRGRRSEATTTSDSTESGSTEQEKTDLFVVTLELLGKYAEMYKSLTGFIELWDPVLEIVQKIDLTRLPEFLQIQINHLIDRSTRLLKFARQERQPLRLQDHKPIPIRTQIPKFDAYTSSSHLYQRERRWDHEDRERHEAAKLRKQYKEERKGAIRELRKDNRFLATVEQEARKEKDRVYHDKMKKVYGSFESERAEQKKMERQKSIVKRRAGRK